MTTEALIEAMKSPGDWEAFDMCSGTKGEWFKSSEWMDWPAHQLIGTKFRHVQSPQSDPDPPAEMDAERATEWLLGGDNRAVLTSAGGSWTSAEVKSGAVGPIKQYDPHTPLVPLARGQLAEIEMLTKERDSALGSQKAALAALEQERKENAGLRVCNIRQGEAIDEIKNTIESLMEWYR